MRVEFRESFEKDLRTVLDGRLLRRVEKAILQLEAVELVTQIAGLEKLAGYRNYFRIRVGDYRLGLVIIGETATCVRFLHRREIYRYFP
jgi:mRNA interferase RelE/StbE